MELNAYALLIGAGASLGLYRVSRQRSGQWLDAGLLVLLFTLLGARGGFVLERFSYYAATPAEIPFLQAGGLSGYGAVLGWLVGLGLAALLFRAPLLRLSDWLYPLIPPLGIAVYLACWQAGAAYGREAPLSVWGVPGPDESGQIAPRWPLQPAAALALLAFYWLLELRTPLPRPAGWLSSLAGAWLVGVDLLVSLLRADPAPHLAGGLRPDTLVDLAVLILFLGIFTSLQIIARKQSKPVIML